MRTQDERVEVWGKEFCKRFGIDWRYVNFETIRTEYLKFHPEEVSDGRG